MGNYGKLLNVKEEFRDIDETLRFGGLAIHSYRGSEGSEEILYFHSALRSQATSCIEMAEAHTQYCSSTWSEELFVPFFTCF